MRQFVSIRFWLALAALAGLWWLVSAVQPSGQADAPFDTAAPGGVADEQPVDTVQLALALSSSDDFALVDGRTTGLLRIILDGGRTMDIVAGTPGSITCDRPTELAQCVVAADLLGDAVLWFSIIPGDPKATVTLPAIREVRDDGLVLLANGWELRRATLVDRSCDADTESLADFIRRFGDTATSTYDFQQQRVIRVTCGADDDTTSTTTTTTSPVPLLSTPGSSIDDTAVDGEG